MASAESRGTARRSPDDLGRSERLRRARIDAGFASALAAAEAHGWNRNTYKSNENGNAPFSYRMAEAYGAAFGVRPEWLYAGTGAAREDGRAAMVPIIGRVGANPDGSVLLSTGQEGLELTPVPPGGSGKAVALRVVGESMRGLADDGALIYFEDQRTPPTPDMLGQVVVVETDTDEVLVKRLVRGSKAGVYSLESLDAPVRADVRLRWAAHITAIVPPFHARRITTWAGA
ncbi:helix-turn-helix transcriptional regulator [Phenylobacterium terrae]|uniref:Helix-turn-helix transcriptional regulator n=1 Tax=Phenylobacterium terrae TaxID=2665495 RepID=A0ABW4N5X8_9CAUL